MFHRIPQLALLLLADLCRVSQLQHAVPVVLSQFQSVGRRRYRPRLQSLDRPFQRNPYGIFAGLCPQIVHGRLLGRRSGRPAASQRRRSLRNAEPGHQNESLQQHIEWLDGDLPNRRFPGTLRRRERKRRVHQRQTLRNLRQNRAQRLAFVPILLNGQSLPRKLYQPVQWLGLGGHQRHDPSLPAAATQRALPHFLRLLLQTHAPRGSELPARVRAAARVGGDAGVRPVPQQQRGESGDRELRATEENRGEERVVRPVQRDGLLLGGALSRSQVDQHSRRWLLRESLQLLSPRSRLHPICHSQISQNSKASLSETKKQPRPRRYS